MGIGEIIALVMLGILGLFILITALIGLGRGLKKTLGSMVMTILSVVVAILLMVLVIKPLILDSGIITGAAERFLANTELADILAMPSAIEAVSYYAYMLLAPFAFVMLFILVRTLFGISMLIARRFIPILNNLPGVAKRLGGLGVGAVNGFIWCLIIFMPLLGTVSVANTVMTNLQVPENNVEESVEAGSVTLLSSEQKSEMDKINEYIAPLVESGAGKVLLSCGGDLLYDTVAGVQYYGERVTLSSEATVIVGVVNDFTSASEEDNMAVIAVDAALEAIGGSPIIKNLSAEVISGAAQAWTNNETFMGMEKISMGEMFDPTMDVVLEILATESRECIYDDLNSIAGFVHALDEHGMLDQSGEGESMIDAFGKKGIFVDLLSSIENNDRMLPIIDEVNAFAIRIFTSNMGMTTDPHELYNDLMQSLGETVNQYNSGMMTRDEAETALIEAFYSHGIVIIDEEVDNVVDAMLDEYNVAYDDMPERLGEFFAVYLGTASGALIENSDGTLSMGEMTLNYYSVSDYKSSQAYILAVNGKSIGKAETLFCAESMESVIVTADVLMSHLVSYAEVEDRHAETEMIDEVIVSLVNAYKNMDGSGMDIPTIMAELGGVLDQMHATSVYGKVIDDFLVAIMQSDKVSGTIGLNLIEMTDVANSINDGISDGAKYVEVTKTVSHSISMLEKVNNGEASQEVVQDLMKDITPSSAKVMQNIATPSLMKNYGVGEENAEKSSSAVSSLFGNMANYTENHPQGDMSDEEYKASIEKESQAVEKIVSISIKATEEKDEAESLFTTEDGDGALDMSAYDVVDLFITSTVATDTVNDLVVGDGENEGGFDPLGIENRLTDSDKAEISNALDEYKANNSHVEGIDESLANIGAMFGIVYGEN